MIKYKKYILLFLVIITLALISVICMKKNMEMILIAIILAVPFLIYCNKNPKRYVYFQLIYNLLIKYLISDWGIPSFANYITDVITVLCVYYAVKKIIKEKEKVNFKSQFIIVILMLLSSVLGLIINGQSILLYIWGFRNIYRFFAFFFAAIIIMDSDDVKNVFKIFKIFLYINFVLCSYQYFIQGLPQDNVSGTFGTLAGGNGYMNLFLIIIFTNEILLYINKKTKLKSLVFVIVSTIYIATISELKIYYIEFILITLLAVFLNKPNKKVVIILVFSSCALVVGIRVLYEIYPAFAEFFSIENIMSYTSESGYSNSENLNRFTAISDIDEMFLNNVWQKIFGIGMGSAEVSQLDLFNSDFYKRYSYLAYNWFSHAFMILENGFLGLFLYVLFFISLMKDGLKLKKKRDIYIYKFVIILSIMAILNMFYNASLRNECAYIFYFALASMFVQSKNNNIES